MARVEVSASPVPRSRLPPRLLPVLYFGVSHVALALACFVVAYDPRGVTGFFYHARMRMWIPATLLYYEQAAVA